MTGGVLDLLLRRPRLTLAGWTLVVAAAWLLHPPPSSWHFFHDAAGLLAGPARLGMWRSHPELQFGPATVVVALVVRLVGGTHDAWVARFLVFPLAPALVWLVEDAARAVRPAADARLLGRTALLAGLVLVPIWDYVALGSLHIDDAVALTFATVAIWAVARRHPLLVGVAIGLAANAKPWAVVFLPLAWVVPAEDRRTTVVAAVGLTLLPWAPFLLGAPGTLTALRSFHIQNDPSSALRALGVHSRSTPVWDRPVQLVAGFVGTAFAARRGRWAGILLVGVAIRLLLDPGAHLYYTAGLVVAALVWDLVASTADVPWTTLLTAAALQLPRVLAAPHAVSGWLRVAATVGAVVTVFATPVAGAPVDAPTRVDAEALV